MNSLQEIVQAIRTYSKVIRAAYAAGLYEIQRNQQVFHLEKDAYHNVYIGTIHGRINLDPAHVEEIATEFETFMFVARTAEEFLLSLLENFKKAKETFAPFILQEKLS